MAKIYITKRAAINAAGGSQGKLARKLGLTPAAVSQWGRYVPVTRAPHVLAQFPEVAHRVAK